MKRGEKKHMIVSADAQKTFDKIQHLFMKKLLRKLRVEGNYLNIIKALIRKEILTYATT